MNTCRVTRILLHLESINKNGLMKDKESPCLQMRAMEYHPEVSVQQEYFRGKTYRRRRIYIQMYFKFICTYTYIKQHLPLMLETISFIQIITYLATENYLSNCVHLIKQRFVLQIHTMISKLEVLPGFALQLPNFALVGWLVLVDWHSMFSPHNICQAIMSLFNINKE